MGPSSVDSAISAAPSREPGAAAAKRHSRKRARWPAGEATRYSTRRPSALINGALRTISMADPEALSAGTAARQRRAWPASIAAEQAESAPSASAKNTKLLPCDTARSLAPHLDLAMARAAAAPAPHLGWRRQPAADVLRRRALPPGLQVESLHASALLLRLADRRCRVHQHGHRRQRAHRLLLAVSANSRRVRLGRSEE